MTAPNLGEVPNHGLRDAVHIPVIAVRCGVRPLQPGQRVEMLLGHAVAALSDGIGIVDPYRIGPIAPYTPFWLFMRKIDGTPRHTWTSPDFPDEVETAREEGRSEGECCYGGG